MQPAGAKASGFIGIFIIQVTIIILFGIFVRYDISMLPEDFSPDDNSTSTQLLRNKIGESHKVSYPREYWKIAYYWKKCCAISGEFSFQRKFNFADISLSTSSCHETVHFNATQCKISRSNKSETERPFYQTNLFVSMLCHAKWATWYVDVSIWLVGDIATIESLQSNEHANKPKPIFFSNQLSLFLLI